MNKLILIVLAFFTTVTVNVAVSETLKQQQAKQTGLNTASPNQMFTQRLGTELMLKSQKAAIASYVATSDVTSGTIVFNEKGTNTPFIMPACSYISASADPIFSFPTAASSATVDTELELTLITSGDLSSIANLPAEIASLGTDSAKELSVASSIVVPCSSATAGVTGVVSGTILSGSQIDLIIKYMPFNQNP